MKARRFSFDMALDDNANPVAGDVLFATKAVYLIVESRPVESRVWGNRWALTVERIGTKGDTIDYEQVPDGSTPWHSSTYARGEGPADYFGTPGG